MNETWFLLFEGTSVDGRGSGKYVGRTINKLVAREHYNKCRDNPYSTGYLIIITDTSYQKDPWNVDWNKL